MKLVIGLLFFVLLTSQQIHAQFKAEPGIPANLVLHVDVAIVNLTITDSNYSKPYSTITEPTKWINSGLLHYAIAEKAYSLTLPAYVQGKFCDFEDAINKKYPFRIDFSVK